MKKQKENKQKGITLIALIITIIVMLILVGVSVSVALNGGLFKTAKEAADKTKIAVQEESSLKYEYEIAKATGKFTGKYDEYVLQEKYGLKIGDKVNYDEGTEGSYTTETDKGVGVSFVTNSSTLTSGTYTISPENGTVEAGDLEWRVLGINDEGQVELISTTVTKNTLAMSGEAGYLNAVSENGKKGTLDTFCDELYGKGEWAESARSLKLEDINKLANFNPKTDYSGYEAKYRFKYYQGMVYGINVESITNENINTINGWTGNGWTFYTTLDGKTIGTNGNVDFIEEINTHYTYSLTQLEGASEIVDFSELLCSPSVSSLDGTGLTALSNRWVRATANGFFYDIAFIMNNNVGTTSIEPVKNPAFTSFKNRTYYMRPVVTLKSDVSFERKPDSSYNLK